MDGYLPCIIQLALLVLTGVFTVMSAALEELNLNNGPKKDSEDKKSKKTVRLKENESVFISACRFWNVALYIGVGVMFFGAKSPAEHHWAIYVLWIIAAAFVALGVSLCAVRIAAKFAEEITQKMQGAMWSVYSISRPFVAGAAWLGKLAAVIFGVSFDEKPENVTEEEIRMMVDIGTQSGAIAPQEQEFIKNIFEFDNMCAGDVMTHRTDVAVLKMGDDPREWEKTVRDSGFSRFPVCGNGIDDIVGIVHSRELYEFLYDGSGSVKKIIRPAYIVPETVQADILFRNMQKEKNPIAVVVDEYGGFSGIVTIDDLLEELVGRIVDEKDEQAEPEEEIVSLDNGTWSVDGTAPLDDVSEALGVSLPTGEYDTIGGMIFAQMGKIPKDMPSFEIEAYGLLMKVTKITDRRIERVLVCIAQPEEEADNSESNSKQN